MPVPHLTFFCTLDANDLDPFLTTDLLDQLVGMKAGISLAVRDLSDQPRAERLAAVVRRLNQAGIPLVAWLLLPESQGTFFNLRNASEAAALYPPFRSWTHDNGLEWVGVGLGFEPDIHDLDHWTRKSWRHLPLLLRRAFEGRIAREGRGIYNLMVARIWADGYRVESYQNYLIADERFAHSSLIERTTGVVELLVDREVLLLCTSYQRTGNGQVAPGFLWSYAQHALAIGVGSTGEDMRVYRKGIPPLTWKELARDLRLAWNRTDDIYIFNLEGCAAQGFLPLLKDFVWDQPILLPEQGVIEVAARRKALHAILWVGSHAWVVIASVLGTSLAMFLIIFFMKRRKRSAR